MLMKAFRGMSHYVIFQGLLEYLLGKRFNTGVDGFSRPVIAVLIGISIVLRLAKYPDSVEKLRMQLTFPHAAELVARQDVEEQQ